MTGVILFEFFDTPQSRSNLIQIYADVKEIGDDFSGIGFIFCSNESDIIHIPMYENSKNISEFPSIRKIMNSARKTASHHDGFHLLASDWTLLECNTYIFCKKPDQIIENKTNYGSRYLTALICSSEPSVFGCLTVSSMSRRITIFQNNAAQELFDEKLFRM